jgi:iron complex outermembrane recepter protein
VVTADRAETPLAASVAAVSRLTAPQLARTPRLTLADALRYVPGFAVVSFDGLGYEPQLMTRGFYGGGEAEYVVVLVDGKPINNVQSGGITWDALPGAAESVEIVRGGASALYGDAALAGIINVITRAPQSAPLRFSLSGGSFSSVRGEADVVGTLGSRGYHAWGGADMTDGFRDHGERTVFRGGGDLAITANERGSLTLTGLGHWREFDDPGPLLDSDLDDDRANANPFFRFDRTRDRNVRLGLDLDRTVGSANRLTGSIFGEQRSTNAVRTLALTPAFADTKERALRTMRGAATAQLTLQDTPIPLTDRLVMGVDAAYGMIDSKYYNIVAGPVGAYDAATGTRDDLDASGEGNRVTLAAFASYSVNPIDIVRLSLGVRADWLSDTFDSVEPADARIETSHDAISPKAGINVQYVSNAAHTGHVYLSAGRSFKAPTLDQMFDLRQIPIPFPPFSVTTSNAELEPQHGTSIEGGIYHDFAITPDRITAGLSLSAYQMKMKDELDFDVTQFKYVNIGRSKHRGVEAGLQLNAPRTSAFLNYTVQRVTAEAGDNAGKYLKAIPRNTLSGGLNLAPFDNVEVGAFVSHQRDMYLDDANTMSLPDYTRVDTRLSVGVTRVRVFFDVRNLLDSEFSSSGFPDPSGSGAIYYYPAAGRTFELGVRSGR